MSYFLAMLFIAVAGVLVFKYVIIQRYSIKKALYYTLSILGMIMILLFLSNIYNFKLGRNLSTLLLLLPLGLIIAYCEKFFIKEIKPATALQHRVTPEQESVIQNRPDYKKEFKE